MITATYSISDNNWPEFKRGFLKAMPIPLDENDNPIMSESAWVRECGLRFFRSTYKNGIHSLATEQATVETELIE